MNRFMIRAATLMIAVGIFTCGCGNGQKPSAKKADIPGACECATECANTTMVDDPQGLVTCKNECAKKFGSVALAEGLKRSMEVMSGARESCKD